MSGRILLCGVAAVAIGLGSCAPPSAVSVTPAVPSANALQRASELLRADNEWTLSQQISICEIPAPPFREQRRAEEFARRLRALGLANVRLDRVGNVIGEYRGAAPNRVVVLSAHLDTVFPEGTDVRVRRTADTLRGPGISDDCRGLAVMLAVARALRMVGLQTVASVYFVGTVGEEGAGNLRGVRHLFESELAGRIAYFISVDGGGLGMTSTAVGSNRYRVTYHGPGGHSYGAFGMPNPIHALGRAMARISDIRVPSRPRTTFSIGVIEGGTSVNSISGSATMDVDLRSESRAALARLDSAFRAAVMQALTAERARWPQSTVALNVRIDTIGIRPAGAQPDSTPIVQVALRVARELGFEARTGASSTDANVPISLGVQAIEMDGGGQGHGSHSLSEHYIDGSRGWLGAQWVLLTVSRLAGARGL